MPKTVVRTNVGTTAGTTTTMTTAQIEWNGSFLITMAISGTFVGLVLVAIGCGCCLRCGRTRLDSIYSSSLQDRIPQGSRKGVVGELQPLLLMILTASAHLGLVCEFGTPVLKINTNRCLLSWLYIFIA